MTMKYSIASTLALAALPMCRLALAQDAAADSDAPYAITGNVAVVSDYMFRGLTQTWGKPGAGR